MPYAVAIHEPWATLVVRGVKTTVDQRQKTKLREPIFVVTPTAMVPGASALCAESPYRGALRKLGLPDFFNSGMVPQECFALGHAIGTITIKACLAPNELSREERANRDRYGDRKGQGVVWVLESAAPLAVPVPVVPRIGLFKLEVDADGLPQVPLGRRPGLLGQSRRPQLAPLCQL